MERSMRLAAALLAFVAASSCVNAWRPNAPVPRLEWGPCPAEWEMISNSSKVLQCATATVPMDYTTPGCPNITLAVAKLPASPRNASQTKLGTLWFNPGGPGISGLDLLAVLATVPGFLPPELLARFDIASWDPRGVGTRGTHVQCFDSKAEQEAFEAVQIKTPRDEAELERMKNQLAWWAKQCGKRNGALLNHLSTADTATDLDLLRQAVGDAGLYYWGISYGTILGQVYANMFPDKVKALVIDSVVDPNVWSGEGLPGVPNNVLPSGTRFGQDLGFYNTLMQLIQLCGAAPDGNCPFSGGSYAQTRVKYEQLISALRERNVVGIPAGAKGNNSAAYNVTYGPLLDDVAQRLYTASGFPGIAEDLQLAWLYRNSPPVPPLKSQSNSTAKSNATNYYDQVAGLAAIGCAEVPNSHDWATYVRQSQEEWPRGEDFSTLSVLGFTQCVKWPAKAKRVYSGPWNKTTSAPLLVVSNTQDPATPIVNAERTAFGRLSGARFLKVEGWGHGVIGTSQCANDVITRYLVDGTLPAEDTVCKQDHVPFSGTKPSRRARVMAEILSPPRRRALLK